MTTILMDTPYRLKRLLEELAELNPPLKKEIFLALDLNTSTEELFLGFPKDALKAVTDLKREFILIVAD
jgi:16S rRNA (cytidine1402-2'-O)-methyltransferase